jgi:hypothetical protein
VVQAWYLSEVQYYSWSTWDCDTTISDKAQCGHMTQVMWANSEFLGCARHLCTAGNGNQWTNVVCHYAPGGNFKGAQPAQMAEVSSCSDPTRQLNCEFENLCSVNQSDDQRKIVCADDESADPLMMTLGEGACERDSKYFSYAFTRFPAVCGRCELTVDFSCENTKGAQ